MRATVMGTGSWGTAFGMVLTDAGTDVTMWGYEPEVCDLINRTHENSVYHPGIGLDENVRATNDAADALADAEIVVFAVPAQTLRANLVEWKDVIPPDALLVSLMKGIELNTAKRMTQVIGEMLGTPDEQLVAVSGPNLAREIAKREPAATTVACSNEQNAIAVQHACHTSRFRPYTNTDVVGTELGGAVKNVIALATGIADGLEFGENAKAAVITRGLAETTRLGVAMGASPATFAGLAGLGDLVATCMSPLSRNRSFGERMGRGETVAEIAASTRQVAEGVKSCESILEMASAADVPMPIVAHVVSVVRGELTPIDMMDGLLSRDVKSE
ncbi:MAG: NAD(P)H-dependent glycerol-3-phosphate dehydrogenase [Jiangellales bacterium]